MMTIPRAIRAASRTETFALHGAASPKKIVVIGAGLAGLTAAYELLAQKYAPNYPSFMSFITGPSRTGDIERILVLGAHGPKKLTIFLLP